MYERIGQMSIYSEITKADALNIIYFHLSIPYFCSDEAPKELALLSLTLEVFISMKILNKFR